MGSSINSQADSTPTIMNMDKAWASLGALFAFLSFLQGLINTFLPYELSSACRTLGVRAYNALFSGHVHYTVEEYDGAKANELYAAVQLHLSEKAASNARRLKLTQPRNASALTCSLGEHERVLDTYNGTQIWWEFSSSERNQSMTFSWQAVPDQRRSLHMRIRRGDREKIMSAYLPHLLANAKALKLKQRDRLLYTNRKRPEYDWGSGRKLWESVPFNHPATFHTLALDPALKQKIVDDLTDFSNGEQFYKDAGRAWKRGYLLYGPPGTGKSSMIAAMANFLEYDVYDLELTEVASNASLRSLLLSTSNKAIIVLEDIDCSLDLSERKKKKKKQVEDPNAAKLPVPSKEEKGTEVTLSGLLNFTDGLWSSCGSERIFVFTTNHIEKLDAALLRSGRMDMHIHLSYCGFEAFKVLAKNYLKLEEHELFKQVEAAMQEEGARITPADVSEVMTREKRNPEEALHCLIKEIRESKFKKQESKQEEEEEETEEEEEKKEVISKAEDESPTKTGDTKGVKGDEIDKGKREGPMKAGAQSAEAAGDAIKEAKNEEIERKKRDSVPTMIKAETGDAKNDGMEEEKREVETKAVAESPVETEDAKASENVDGEEKKAEIEEERDESTAEARSTQETECV